MPPEQPGRKRRRRSRFSSNPDAAEGKTDLVDVPTQPASKPKPVPNQHVPPAVAALRARLARDSAQSLTETSQPVSINVESERTPSEPPKPKRRRTRFAALKAPDTTDPTPATTAPPPARATPPEPARTSDLAPRTLDLNAIPVAPVSTLRINRATQQKKKLASLKVAASDLVDENPTRNPYYDPALSAQRKRVERKPLVFTEPGVHAARAERLREEAAAREKKTKFQESLVRQRQTSPLPVLPPRDDDIRVKRSEPPLVEWWDAPLMKLDPDKAKGKGKEGDGDVDMTSDEIMIRSERITHYIHHPPPVKPTIPPKPPPEIPLMLTKKETKKLRRQRRLEAHKEEQEMIAVGLLPPAKPKVKLSNLVRVMASEATADPTKVEAEVRAQVEERRKKHEAENAARKKTPQERKEKAAQKIEKDKSAGLYASVYRISRLDSPHHRFKIDVNARQLEMTGALVLFRDCNVVVVEGGVKAQRKYKKLLLRRIDWSATVDTDSAKEGKKEGDAYEKAGKEKEEHVDGTQKVSCVLVWEGAVQNPSFPPFRTINLPNESACRYHFRKHHVEHYWDLCTQASPFANENLGVRTIE